MNKRIPYIHALFYIFFIFVRYRTQVRYIREITVIMDKKDLDIAYFISFCIEQYKTKYGFSGKEVMSLFEKYDVLQYLSDNFEVLHTQSRQWLIEEIEDYITKEKEKTL